MNYTGSMILFIFLVQLAAYTLKWLIGFGNPLISAPLLAMRLDNTLITPGSLLPDLVINGRITWQNRNNFRWRAILPLLLAMVVIHPGPVHRQPVYRAFPHQLGQCGPRGAQPDREPEG